MKLNKQFIQEVVSNNYLIDKYSIDIFDIKKIAIKKIYIPEKVYLDTVFLINSNLYLFDFGREMKIYRKRINND